MAETVEEETPIVISEEEEEEEEKIIQHYSSFHQILLVGDGDFSFSLCLAHSFASASNIVASSLQSYDKVIKKYKNGKSNIEKLKALGGSVLHGVDATKIQQHPDLRNRKFDRIIYNFPHAGFHGCEDDNHLIQMHKNLVGSFFGSAKKMLQVDGQIHVTHKTSHPYDLWDLVGLGSRNSLKCIECADFKIENYPGYNNKRGSGSKCDEPFHLGECNTFKFRFNPSGKKHYLHALSQDFQNLPNSISPPIYSFQHQLISVDSRNSPTCVSDMNGFLNFQKVPNSINPPIYSHHPAYVNDMNGFPSHARLPARYDPRGEFFRIFKLHFVYIHETFGRVDPNVELSVRRAIHHGALMFRDEARRPPEDYLAVLEEFRCWSRSRTMRLQHKLQDLNRRLFEQQGMRYYL